MAERRGGWSFGRRRVADQTTRAVDWCEAPAGFCGLAEVRRRAPYPRLVTFIR